MHDAVASEYYRRVCNCKQKFNQRSSLRLFQSPSSLKSDEFFRDLIFVFVDFSAAVADFVDVAIVTVAVCVREKSISEERTAVALCSVIAAG